MRKRIRKHLSSLAPGLAANTYDLLSDHNRISALILEERSYTLSLLETFILALAEYIETGDRQRVVQQSREIALFRSKQGIALACILERVRVCRDSLLEQIRRDTHRLIFTEEERLGLYQIQMDLFQFVDTLIDVFIQTYEEDEEQRKQLEMQANSLTKEDFSQVAEQELVQLVLQSTDIAVLIIDRNLRIIEANYSFAELQQVERAQIIGKNIDETFRPRENERFVQWVIERGQSGHYVADTNGTLTTVSTSPIYHQGELWGAISVLRNITDSKRYEDELTKREALAAVGQLAAGMAHEIRNPLTSIKGFIQLLKEQTENAQNSSYFSVILTEIERIDGLLNDVLVLARYRDDKISAERFLLMDEVLGVIRLLEPESNRRGIRLELDWSGDEWYIYGFRARIKQAVLNILKNAMEALVMKGSTVRISVYASINQVVLTVEDDGPGLEEKVLKNLFIPFYTKKPDGTGLGLSTTQRIILDHGGEIFAENSSRLGGARFEVRLPISN
ncbi:ATP-binding protein [Brevibacillus ruminantium]|uniref:histidine kinase n=1 Tax=Brevibacillus ruminantium TaxID=2950604 RepID=A0ABY4WLT9_9BACL|nr:ATP-binding protein [Brevibacillus ruminantium]USG68128.1 ATP-binding protein [Brevibacillus ruminantium]